MIRRSQFTSSEIALPVLIALSLSHCLNDLLQSLLAASYPLFKEDLALSFGQIGLITLVYQMAASVFQPLAGLFFDKRPFVWSLPAGMCFTLVGLLNLAFASNLHWVLVSVFLIGVGSSILHPEASRITSLASGGRRGFAQSVFQVGGNLGGSFGPLLMALLVAPYGGTNIAYFESWLFVSDSGEDPGLPLVQGLFAACQMAPCQCCPACPHAASSRADIFCDRHPADAYLFEIHLYGQPEQLLHFLPDAQVRRQCTAISDFSVCLSVGYGGRHTDGRAYRRPYRPQICNLDVDSGDGAVQYPDAACLAGVDGRTELLCRVHALVSFPGDPALCPRVAA